MIKIHCQECNTLTYKNPLQYKRYNNHFCSNTCYLQWRKKQVKIESIELICKKCQKQFKKKKINYRPNRNYFCSNKCSSKYHAIQRSKKKVLKGTLQESLVVTPTGNKFSKVRQYARNFYHKEASYCQHCNFQHYVEVCHIKPISEFQLDSLIAEINAEENILLLCPRCHWELDHNLLLLEEIGNYLKFDPIQCPKINFSKDQSSKTLEDLIIEKADTSNRYTKVRQDIRRRIKNIKDLSCENCGYPHHIEVCHIQPISTFNKKVKIKKINSPENLLALCRNCHWCLDHGYLKLNEILAKKEFNGPAGT